MTTPPLPDTIEHFLYLQSHPLVTNKNYSKEFRNKLMLRLLQIPEDRFPKFEFADKSGRKMTRDKLWSAPPANVIDMVEVVNRTLDNRGLDGNTIYNKLQMPPYNPII